MTHPPRLSIGLVSTEGGAALAGALAALAPQCRDDVELIVACRAGGSHEVRCVVQDLGQDARCVTVVAGAPDATTPALRREAIQAARGELVALVGDRYVVDPGWAGAISQVHRERPDAAAGCGAIEHGGAGRLFDAAVHYCEYGTFMRPFDAGAATLLPGSNVWFTRAVARELTAGCPDGASEIAWQRHLSARGVAILRDPRPVVWHARRFRGAEYLAERYDYARSMAAERLRGAPIGRRVLHAAKCLLLPIVLTARISRDIGRLPEHRWRVARSLPYLLLFTTVGAAGELAGSVRGAGPARPRT